jgi:hypothetical protein
MYYFNMIWLYNYGHMVTDIVKYGGGLKGPILFAKGLWRYRWLGQTYLPVMHWFDRGLEGMRGEALKASAWHYRAMVSETIRQFMRMFAADANLGGDLKLREKTLAHDETVWGGIFYPWRDRIDDVPLALPVVVVIFWTVVDVLRKPKSFTLQEGTLCAAQYVEKYYPHNIQVNNRRSHTVCVQAEATAIVLVEYCRHDSAVTGGASLGDLHVWGHVVLRDRAGRELDTELLAQPFEAMELYGVEDLEGALAALRAAYPYAVITDMTARS